MQTKTHYFELTAAAFDWKVSEQKTVKAWGFNQQLPGPVIRARKGDTVVVNVKNELSEPTMVHWHGVRLPAAMDGTGVTQRPIQPGEAFEYRFEVPDAGTFWYHSHHNETVQMERGLYGALIVEDAADPVAADRERVLLIDDMKLDAQNDFARGGFIGRWKERHDGREGDTLLINGKEQPLLAMSAGQTERWRLINASSARYVLLHLGGRPFRIIGTDGGLIEAPREATEVLLTPGERLEVLVGPFTEGERFALESLPYNRMTFLKARRQTFATVQVGAPQPSVARIPARLRNLVPLASADAPATRKVKLSVDPSWKHGIDFTVNGSVHTADAPVHVGELQVWEVSNTSLMDHPFHLHGFFFQVLQINGKAPEFLAWKDTVNLPPRSTVKIAWIPDNRPGRWMYHCHILEHHEAGMMAHFDVVDPERGPRGEMAGHACHGKTV
jgi:FtsP/CotA-like multicopper oxidase with cupredoxin domain